MSRAKVLLIGGTGTLSSAVLKRAIHEEYSMTIMNRGTNNKNVPKNVDVIIADFFNSKELNDNFKDKNFDVVVDFLSRTTSDIDRVYPVFRDRCKQYIFVSSACVYKRNKEDFPVKENSPKPNTLWKYNVDKYECEKRLQMLSVGAKSFYTIVRPYITYNPERIPLGISPAYKFHKTVLERIKNGKPWFVWDDGKALTTLTYTEDFAVGMVGLFLNGKAKNEDFHITSDYCYTQKQVIEMLFEKLGMPLNIISIPSKELANSLPEYTQMLLGDRALDAVFDNSKIKDAVPLLNFTTSLDRGLDKVVEYWRKAEPLYDYQFEGRIDFLLSKYGIKTKYIKYNKAEKGSLILYLLYRYLPLNIANKLRRWI